MVRTSLKSEECLALGKYRQGAQFHGALPISSIHGSEHLKLIRRVCTLVCHVITITNGHVCYEKNESNELHVQMMKQNGKDNNGAG